jgi:hypothetical protein
MKFVNEGLEENAERKNCNGWTAEAQTQRGGEHNPPAVKELCALAARHAFVFSGLWIGERYNSYHNESTRFCNV